MNAFAIFLFLLGCCCAISSEAVTDLESENAASASVTDFSFDLLKKIHEDGKNAFFSGYSIAVALGMVSLGARENTFTEIDNAFHFDKVNTHDSKAIHKVFKSCAEMYNKANSTFSLATANRLYGREMYNIEQEYQDDIKTFYGGELQRVDFDIGTAEGIINEWVAEQTNEKIKVLFPEGTLGVDTILVLVNTIYFKAKWENQFINDYTYRSKFFTSATTEVEVDMMIKRSDVNYYSDSELNVKVLELPYEGNELSMFILLPNEINGISALVNSLTAAKLESLLNSLYIADIEVGLPRFKLETEYNLVDELSKLGIQDLFSPDKCNVSAIIGYDNEDEVYVSKAIHKTFVQVTEEGTEAAAVTGVQFAIRSGALQFIANHPFLFIIRDNAYKMPLFVGVVSDPASAEEAVSTSE